MLTAYWLRRLALPLILLVAAAGWSGFWFYAQARVQHEIDRNVAELQSRGGEFACEDRQWQGFPLRLELSCGRLSLDVPGGPSVETARFEAAGAAYDPRQIVAHAERIDVKGAQDWSFAGHDIDLVAVLETLDRARFSASGEALRFEDRRLPALGIDVFKVEGFVEGLPRNRPEDLMALLREAARVGSRVTIDSFRAEMAEIRVTASGSVELGPEGPTGSLSTTVSNYKAFLADLERRGAISKKAVQASAMVIGLLQGRNSDGEVTVDLRFHEGQVFWGPFAVAEIPPLE